MPKHSEPLVPTKLFDLQKWFATLITQPLQPNHQLPSRTPFDTNIEEEASQRITPTPFLRSHQRLELYYQQYWWRLIKCLQESFPMVLRLFGYEGFNQQIAIPYLTANPPRHWALCRLGDTLPQWIQRSYLENDRDLVEQAARMDWAAQAAFWIKALPPVDFAHLTPQERLHKPLALQPHIHLFSLQGDLFSFRETFLEKEPEYWNDHPFPSLRPGSWKGVVFRNIKNLVTWKELSPGEFRFLSFLKEGLTIEVACAKIEEEGGTLLEEALEMMPVWFQEWTFLQWFGETRNS